MIEELYDLDVERAVINGIMNNSNTFYSKEREIAEKMFYLDIHRKIISAIKKLYRSNKNIDSLMVAELVSNEEDYKSIGGTKGLQKIESFAPKNIDSSLSILRKLSIKRNMYQLGKQLENSAMQEDYLENLSDIEREIASINDFMSKEDGKIETMEEVAERTFRKITKTAEDFRNGIIPDTGTKTGIKKLDDCIVGMKGQQLITVGARPSTGKTAFLGQILFNIGRSGEDVLFFNFEMSNEEISERFFTNLSNCSYTDVQKGVYGKGYDNSMSKAFIEQAKAKITLCDTPLTPDQMRIKIKKLMSSGTKLKGIFVDYLEKVKVPKNMESKSLYEKVSYLSNEMKAIAKEFNIFVFCLAQLNRKVDERASKKPMLSDFNNSGVIEADSHCSFMLSSLYKYNPKIKELENIITLDIVKNRSGQLKEILLYFDGGIMEMREASDQEIRVYIEGLKRVKGL